MSTIIVNGSSHVDTLRRRGRAVGVALATTARFDPDVLALFAPLVLFLAHAHVRLSEDLQRDCAQLRLSAWHAGVLEQSVARLAQDRLDLELRTL